MINDTTRSGDVLDIYQSYLLHYNGIFSVAHALQDSA